MSENISALFASLQGNGSVNGLNADISFPATTTPVNDGDLATKSYVDITAEGLHVLTPADIATTADLNFTYNNGTAGVGATLTNGSTGVIPIDGTALTLNMRILVKDQADGDNVQNGIYKVTTAGAADAALVLTRETDFDSPEEIRIGDFVFCINGTANGGHGFVMSSSDGFTSTKIDPAGTVGTSTIVFTQFSGVSETVTVAQGGTGTTTLTQNGVLIGNGVSAVAAVDLSTKGHILIGDGSGNPSALAVGSNNKVIVSDSSEATGIKWDTLAVEGGGTGLSTVADNSVLISTSADTLAALTITGTADLALMYDHSGTAIVWTALANVCFLKGTKITLPNHEQINIEDLTLADEVLTYNIDIISDIKNKNMLKDVRYSNINGRFSTSGIRNIWINPTDSYLIINEKLKVTKNHIVHFKRDNQYYFRFSENLNIGDELLTDKGKYESVESIEEVREKTNVYNFELDKDSTYFAENYLVHHYCELCSGYSNIL